MLPVTYRRASSIPSRCWDSGSHATYIAWMCDGQLVAFEPAERIAGRSLAITSVDGARPVKLITHLMGDHMPTAHLGGSLKLADHFTLSRVGYGALQLARPGLWGAARNPG